MNQLASGRCVRNLNWHWSKSFNDQYLSNNEDIATEWMPQDLINSKSILVQIITVTSQWAGWYLKSPAFRLFVLLFVQANIKENIKARVTGPLWGESTGDRWIPLIKGQ